MLNCKTGRKTHHRLVHTKPVGLFTLSLGLTAIVTPSVLAEDVSKSLLEIEEVVVTAQKRTESLQDAPIAISAFNSRTIEEIGIHNAADIGAYTPNATITQSLGSAFNIRMNIRGNQTADPLLAIDPKVGIYLDGAYIARNAGSVFDIVDLERVEVLRGPQGTLWGKNTTGGALNLITTKPSGELNFKQQVSAGSDGYYRAVTTLDTPAIGKLSSKLSYAVRGTDGWADNVNASTDENELGREESKAFRVVLRWDATEDLSIDYSYDNTDAEAVPVPLQPAKILGSVDPSVITLSPTYAQLIGNVFAQMTVTANDSDRLESFDLDSQGTEFVDISGHNLTVTWATESFEVKSITSYREYESDFTEGQDLDGGFYQAPAVDSTLTAIPAFHTLSTKEQDQFSEEIQLVGSALDDGLKFIIGLYHFEESGKEINPWQITFHNNGTNYLVNNYGSFYKIDSDSNALYSQFTYSVTDRLDLTLGMRFTEDDKELTLLEEDPLPQLDADQTADESWNEFTSSFTASYTLSDSINLYAKVMEGYAAGVFNPGTIDRSPLTSETTEGALTPADPEETLSYELGMKSQLWDNRLRFNAAVFYNDNDNLQITDLVGGQRQIFNSGSSVAQGVEVDITALLSEYISVNASYGYLDVDFDDKKYRQGSPKNTANAGIQYDVGNVGIGHLLARIDVIYSDDVLFSTSDRSVKSDAYSLLNARVSLSQVAMGRGQLRAALWGRNLADKEYIVHGANFGFFTGYTWGTPRSTGLDVIWEF